MDIFLQDKQLIIRGFDPIACAIGPSGVCRDKKEGDGTTPTGRFAFRRVLYRADREQRPFTYLRCQPIRPDDGWCDDVNHPAYNRPVQWSGALLQAKSGAERMWRDDHLYDLCVILGHNDHPPVPGSGSAVFFHLAKNDYSPTQGCVAIARHHMLELLANLDARSHIEIQ